MCSVCSVCFAAGVVGLGAGISIYMSITVKDTLTSALLALEKELADSKERMEIAGDIIIEETEKAFSSRTSSDGKPWKKLSEVTLERKAAGYDKSKGKLQKQLTKGKLKTKAFDIGSKLAYSSAQQFGNPFQKAFGRGKAPLPARPMLPLANVDEVLPAIQEKIVEALDARLETIIKESNR